jgi:hypothetical protein
MNLEKYKNITQRDYEAVAGPDWPSYADFQLNQPVESFVYAEINEMLTGPRKLDNNAYCVLPFFSIELPTKTPCCLLAKDYNIDLIKRNMLDGQRPTACQKCWNLEDAGFKSDRIIKNETLDFYLDQDLTQLFKECQQGKNTTVHYKIDTSNTCNSTCITCNSHLSSLWGQLESRNGIKSNKNWSLSLDQVVPDIDFKTAQSIGFRGGEPLLSATNFKILEKLIEHGNTDCFINFTTNGGVKLTQQQKNILSKFTNINMCFSIDGVGPVFEYLRYPLKWELLLKNIDYCKTHGIIPSVSYTVSNLNVLYFTDTIKWFKQNQLKYIINPVYTPEQFSPNSLPYSVKNIILEKINDSTITALLSKHTDQDEINYKKFQVSISRQDVWKGIRLHDYLPELYKLLG